MRKFSSSIFAKIFLFIIIIPFVFWGMGSMFRSGNVNTIVTIDNDKISTQEFAQFIEFNTQKLQISSLDKKLINDLLYNFIGEKLILKEIESLNINLTDKSLSKMIKNEKLFKRKNKFSRIEYEKFLIKNNFSAPGFETDYSNQLKKELLFSFISGGVNPSFFLTDSIYNKINQKRKIELIDLNILFGKKLDFTEEEIKTYYNKNKEKFINIYKSINYIKLTPKNLSGSEDYNDLFFERIDEIDDLIVDGSNLNFIKNKFNLDTLNSFTTDKSGLDKNSKKDDNLSNKLINKVFNIDENEPTTLVEHNNQFFIIEVVKTESVQKKISDVTVKKEIILNLQNIKKRKTLAEIISKINSKKFNKSEFYQFSKDKNISIKKVNLESKNDNKALKKDIVNQIYKFPGKRVIIVYDANFSENYLIYIDKVENKSINKNSDDYKKYVKISREKVKKNLYKTYDAYLNNKYEIDINYKALDGVSNYFR